MAIIKPAKYKKSNKSSKRKAQLKTPASLAAENRKLRREITKHKRADEQLRKLSRAIEQSQITVVITDLAGNIEYVNPKFVEITGYSAEEALGNNPRIMKSGETSPEEYRQLWESIKSGRTWHGTFHNKKKNGDLYWEAAVISPIFNANGKVTHFVAVKEDITERKLAEAALRQHALELDAFAHTVAHDIKNPISAIIGFSDLLLIDRGSLPEDQIELALHKINRSAWKMNRIVDEIMLLTGLRKETVTLQPVDMNQIITESRERLAIAIREAQAEISMLDQSNWPIALGYAPWIEEVWVNYISNAIKYGGQPPRIELGAAQQANHVVRFWVRDNGNGLNAEEQSHLFTPLTRLNQVRVKGHGLGLSIVKRIVEKLGGTVGVDSELGCGSTFYFTLPLDTSSYPSQ